MDMYPYIAGSTDLVRILPGWAQEGGLEEIYRRLQDPAARAKMAQSMREEGFFKVAEWDKVLVPLSANPAHIGKTIATLAESAGKSPHEWIFDALLETRAQISMVLFLMSEENVKMQMTHPHMMFGTDGIGLPFEGRLVENAPHPRSFGTYPRILGKYVREERVLALEDAIWRMTGYPAQRLRLKSRGLIRQGYQADLVIFDPATIRDTADFVRPNQKPVGIQAVIVNGSPVVREGCHTHARPGRITTRE
jgi:N-acyl-D-amino-acid deacylase